MIDTRGSAYLEDKFLKKRDRIPLTGLLELTYRCNYNCIHCYCKGMENAGKDISFAQWRRIMDELAAAGTVWLGLSGGECLLRNDFLHIYRYAKRKGFLISILTNGSLLTPELIAELAKSPPYCVEITLNGATTRTYDKITGTKNHFNRVRKNIRQLKHSGISVRIKANVMRENAGEMSAIKTWANRLPGRTIPGRYNFSLDPFIYPRLDGGMQPCRHRITQQQLKQVYASEPELKKEYSCWLRAPMLNGSHSKNALYLCDSWKNNFSINPYGLLKFCQWSNKFSADLLRTSFEKGFAGFARVARAKFKTNSKCIKCRYRMICGTCPARAALEIGNEEAPVPDYCARAKEIMRQQDGKLS